MDFSYLELMPVETICQIIQNYTDARSIIILLQTSSYLNMATSICINKILTNSIILNNDLLPPSIGEYREIHPSEVLTLTPVSINLIKSLPNLKSCKVPILLTFDYWSYREAISNDEINLMDKILYKDLIEVAQHPKLIDLSIEVSMYRLEFKTVETIKTFINSYCQKFSDGLRNKNLSFTTRLIGFSDRDIFINDTEVTFTTLSRADFDLLQTIYKYGSLRSLSIYNYDNSIILNQLINFPLLTEFKVIITQNSNSIIYYFSLIHNIKQIIKFTALPIALQGPQTPNDIMIKKEIMFDQLIEKINNDVYLLSRSIDYNLPFEHFEEFNVLIHPVMLENITKIYPKVNSFYIWITEQEQLKILDEYKGRPININVWSLDHIIIGDNRYKQEILSLKTIPIV